MHYIEVYFSQQFEFGVSLNSSIVYYVYLCADSIYNKKLRFIMEMN